MIEILSVPGRLVELCNSGVGPPDIPDHYEAVLFICEKMRRKLKHQWVGDDEENGEVYKDRNYCHEDQLTRFSPAEAVVADRFHSF